MSRWREIQCRSGLTRCIYPFAEKSVDACPLAHTLPWCSDPHRLLREADRVLIDDGWMILTGFNPVSLMGLRKLVPVLRKGTPYNSRMFTLMRQLDWLALLNFEVLHYGRYQVLPWSRHGGKLLSTHLPALGCLVIDCRPQTDHSADAQSDEIRQSEKLSCGRKRWRHPAVAQRAELTLRQVADIVQCGWRTPRAPTRRSVHFQDGRRGPLPIPI